MKIEPLYKALESITPFNKGGKGDLITLPKWGGRVNTKTILLSAKGKTWNQRLAKSHAKLNNIILICGRYEGVDERIKKFVDEEISIGDYVLTGGEIGALAIIDSITRLLPGALGNSDSAKYESHATPGVLEYPHYTRPEIFSYSPLIKGVRGIKKLRVPKILLSGDHKKIAAWRVKKSKQICHS